MTVELILKCFENIKKQKCRSNYEIELCNLYGDMVKNYEDEKSGKFSKNYDGENKIRKNSFWAYSQLLELNDENRHLLSEIRTYEGKEYGEIIIRHAYNKEQLLKYGENILLKLTEPLYVYFCHFFRDGKSAINNYNNINNYLEEVGEGIQMKQLYNSEFTSQRISEFFRIPAVKEAVDVFTTKKTFPKITKDILNPEPINTFIPKDKPSDKIKHLSPAIKMYSQIDEFYFQKTVYDIVKSDLK